MRTSISTLLCDGLGGSDGGWLRFEDDLGLDLVISLNFVLRFCLEFVDSLWIFGYSFVLVESGGVRFLDVDSGWFEFVLGFG